MQSEPSRLVSPWRYMDFKETVADIWLVFVRVLGLPKFSNIVQMILRCAFLNPSM